MSLRILLADDHNIMRQGLKALLEQEQFQVVAEASDGHVAISAKTPDSHRTRMMRKLEVHETASLVRHAIRLGLIEP